MYRSIEIWTDGSCLKNPNGPGGWAYRILPSSGESFEDSGGDPSTTNNRMEMMAVVMALKKCISEKLYAKRMFIYSDSKYVLLGMDEWLPKWKRNKWKTSAHVPVANQDLWEQIDTLKNKLPKECLLVYKHIKGHTGVTHNEWCDERACTEAEMIREGSIKEEAIS